MELHRVDGAVLIAPAETVHSEVIPVQGGPRSASASSWSEATVKIHVSHILPKPDAPSRGAVAFG
jgi:hypothetical protein